MSTLFWAIPALVFLWRVTRPKIWHQGYQDGYRRGRQP